MSLCFIHVPKTGGASFHQFLLERTGATEMPGHLEPMLPMFGDRIRAGQYKYIHGHYRLETVARYHTGPFFTMVRDPIDRVVSLYNFLGSLDGEAVSGLERMQTTEFEYHSPEVARYAATSWLLHTMCSDTDFDFYDFVRLGDMPGLISWHNLMSFLPDSGDAKAYADRFLFVGLTERMEESARRLCGMMGWEYPGAVPRVNESAKKLARRSDVGSSDEKIVRERCAFEFALYDEARRRFDA